MPVDPSMIAGAVGGAGGATAGTVDPSAAAGASKGTMPSGGQSQSGGSFNAAPGAISAGMGALQMAVGYAQLRKAKRLPFPGYLATKGPLAQMKSLYESQMRQGIGSEQRGIMRMQGAQTNAQQMNAISQNSAQGSQLLGRTAALNRTGTEAKIADADYQARQSSMSGVERMNAAMTAIEQKDIAAKRDYRLMAERAAGAAIKRGSENIAGFVAEEGAYNRKNKES